QQVVRIGFGGVDEAGPGCGNLRGDRLHDGGVPQRARSSRRSAKSVDRPARVHPVTQRRLPAPRTPDPVAAPPLRWGILAPGWIAGQFAAALRRGTRQRIAAVGSRNLDRARAFADEHGAPTAYGSYDALVHDPQVDIVYVASPHSEHHRQARLALEAGKPVLVEKAFTRNAAEARDLIDLARANGLFVLEGMWSRFLPHYDV